MHGIWDARTYHPLLTSNRILDCGHDGVHEDFYVGFCISFFIFVRPVAAFDAPSSSRPCHNCLSVSVKLIVALCAQRNLQAVFASQGLRNRVVPMEQGEVFGADGTVTLHVLHQLGGVTHLR